MELTDQDVGIITSGASYNYVKEAFGDRYSVLKLGLVYPLDQKTIRDYARQVKKIYIVEELDPYLEFNVRAMVIECEGKKYISPFFELNPQIVATSLAKAGLEPLEELNPAAKEPAADVPVRPPILCAVTPECLTPARCQERSIMMGRYRSAVVQVLHSFKSPAISFDTSTRQADLSALYQVGCL